MEKYDEKAVSVLARAFADNIKNVKFDYEGFIQKDNGDGTCQVIVNQQRYDIKNGQRLHLNPEINVSFTVFPETLTGR